MLTIDCLRPVTAGTVAALGCLPTFSGANQTTSLHPKQPLAALSRLAISWRLAALHIVFKANYFAQGQRNAHPLMRTLQGE